MNAQVTVNMEQGLYVIPCEGGGFSCLGFDVAFRRASDVAEWCQCQSPDKTLVGTLAGYADYERCMSAGNAHNQATGKRCPAELTPQLNGLEGKRVQVTDKYGETRRFNVGKSTGWMPCHLEVANRRSTGGCAVSGAPFKSIRVVG